MPKGKKEPVVIPLGRQAEPEAIAQYRAPNDGSWTDVLEAKPRCRVRMKEGSEGTEIVRVFGDGTIDVPKGVEVDEYVDMPHMRDEEIP